MKNIIERILDEGLRPRHRYSIQRAKKRRARRMRSIQALTVCIAFITFIALAVTYNVKAKEKKQTKETIETVQQERKLKKEADKIGEQMEGDRLGTIAENETPKERLARVKKQAKDNGYPEGIIELLSKNEETVGFVEDFEKKKDKPTAKTLGDSFKKGKIPHLLQWDERWGYATYGTGYIATSGCGPTCVAMVAAGLNKDPSITPVTVARYSEEEGYIDEANNTYWNLMRIGIEHWGITCSEGSTDEEFVAAELKKGHPIICSVGPGDFTQIGHFIVLTSYKDGKVKVNDPFSIKNTEKKWKYSKIKDQIKALWVYKKAE